MECVMCGKKQTWGTTLVLKPNNLYFSVCPDCREKYTLSQIYTSLIDALKDGRTG